MSDLRQKASQLRSNLPKNGQGTPPAMKGQLLGTLPHKEGSIRIVWDEYEGHSYLSIRLWTANDSGQLWPSKIGFTVRIRDLPALGEAIGKALDLAIAETGREPGGSRQKESKPFNRSQEGVGAPF